MTRAFYRKILVASYHIGVLQELDHSCQTRTGTTRGWRASVGVLVATIPDTPGVWATGATRLAAEAELQSTVEDWIALGLAQGDPLPPIGDHHITIHLTEKAS